jgi:hypothetical protein
MCDNFKRIQSKYSLEQKTVTVRGMLESVLQCPLLQKEIFSVKVHTLV